MVSPSKELVEEVLNIKLCESGTYTDYLGFDYRVKDIYISLNEVIYWECDSKDKTKKHINIYELMHKMKMWANSNSYTLLAFGNVVYLIDDKFDSEEICFNEHKSFYGDTEIKAIFKACEWVLKQKENK